MSRPLAVLLAVLALAVAPQNVGAQSPSAKLTVVDTFHIGNATRWDYSVVDSDSHRNEDKSEINVIDTKAMKPTDRWPLAPLETPTGLAIDLDHHRLFTVGKNKTMAIVDYENGKVLATVPIGMGPDGCAFLPKLGLSGGALSSNGRDGTATVVAETSPGKFAAVQTVETAKSGRTITADPLTGRIYIPAMVAGGSGSPEFGVIVLGTAN